MWRIYAGVTSLIFLMMLASCGGGGASSTPDDITDTPQLIDKPEYGKGSSLTSMYADPEPDFTWDLIAGQHFLAGSAKVWNDAGSFHFEFAAVNGWEFKEIHVYAGDSVPKKAAPGQFPYKYTFKNAVSAFSFDAPLGDLGLKDTFFCAIHATVTGNGTETAWGGQWNSGTPRYQYEWGKQWGGYFSSTVMPVFEPQLATYIGKHYGTYSYWNIIFTGDVNPYPALPDAVHPVAGNPHSYVGWCVDRWHLMYTNTPYTVTLYSTYDPDIPAFGASDNWDLINFMVNQRNNPDAGSPFDGVNWMNNGMKDQFEYAMWYFSDAIAPPAGSLAEQFIQYAKDNGEDYIPGAGDYFGVLAYPGGAGGFFSPRAQMNYIEVDP